MSKGVVHKRYIFGKTYFIELTLRILTATCSKLTCTSRIHLKEYTIANIVFRVYWVIGNLLPNRANIHKDYLDTNKSYEQILRSMVSYIVLSTGTTMIHTNSFKCYMWSHIQPLLNAACKSQHYKRISSFFHTKTNHTDRNTIILSHISLLNGRHSGITGPWLSNYC